MADIQIHRLNTAHLEISPGLCFFGEGRHPDIPGGHLRCDGWRHDIARVDGSNGIGVWGPAPAWYIEGARHRILIDTGAPPADEVLAWQQRYGFKQAIETTPEQDLVRQLEALGVASGEIDIVVQTHLHLDHVGATKRFPNATYIVHEAELPWALCPPPYAGYYYRDFSHYTRAILDQIRFITADYQIEPGIKVVWTGGHSPGHCVVFADTAIGSVCIAGDAVYNYRNLEFEWPQGPVYDIGDAVRAINTVRMADVILLSHDVLFDELFPTGVVGAGELEPRTREYMERIRMARGFQLREFSEQWPRPAAGMRGASATA